VTDIVQQGGSHEMAGCAGGFCKGAGLKHMRGQAHLLAQITAHALSREELRDAFNWRRHSWRVRRNTASALNVWVSC
jgi:hypothetical protein